MEEESNKNKLYTGYLKHKNHPDHDSAIDLIDKILKYESKRITINDIFGTSMVK